MENGNLFVIETQDNSPQNYYIQDGQLNGQPLSRNYITYDEINKGGRLTFKMGAEPNKQRNITSAASPYSVSN